MSSSQVPPMAPAAKPNSPRRVSGIAAQREAEALATLKRSLLIAALETPPRFRSDIDVVMIQQHLASLGVFASVGPQILQYLATECTINRIPDGEVLFYQEDIVDDRSHACIILEGSLCGYFNKAFHQRTNRGDNFRSWNNKKTNARGVAIDFGDLQVTYGKGSMCGIDDFYSSSLSSPIRGSRRQMQPLCRRRSVHSQESTTVIILAKDTLDRVSERFGLTYERGILTSPKETTRTDATHLALFSLLSETARKTLLQSAVTRQLKTGEVLFTTNIEKDSSMAAVAVVNNGSLDVYCVECDDDRVVSTTESNIAHAMSNTPSIPTMPKDPIISLSRGQTFGDQMIGLGHSHIWASNPRCRRPSNLRFMVVAGDPSTEVIWITRDQYEEIVREDHLRLSYSPIFGAARATDPTTSLICAIESQDISQITRHLLTNATVSKFFFQFPPIVLDRLCHHMEIQHYESKRILLEAGGSIDNVYVVVTGAFHIRQVRGPENDRIAQGSVTRLSLSQDVHFIPGDAFGARELMKRCSTCEVPVCVDAGTTVVCIARVTVERWVSPVRHNIVVKAGSILQPFVWSSSSPSTSPRHSYVNSYATLIKVNRRQSGPSALSSAVVDPDRAKARHLDDAAILLKRLGFFQTIPRFLLAQMLAQVTLQGKTAGEELFREGDTQRALVVILSGFVSFYSLENMSVTIDMFRKHPFCIYATFSGSTADPEDYVPETKPDENTPSAALKHRAAIHGVHVQTLPPRNAFRTGVLDEGTICPATVIAQTDCEYLVFDETMYARLLVEHLPAVNMGNYIVASNSSAAAASLATKATSDAKTLPSQPTSKSTGPGTDTRPGAIPLSLLVHLEVARMSWLPLSSAKKSLLLRSTQYMHLAPGQRLVKHNDVLDQLVFVVSGKLAVYVRENQEVTSVLNASQRSVQSAALERSVASNYSTTSQQLYQERAATARLSNRKALQRKIARIAEVEMMDSEKPTTSNSRFTDFVMHAAREAKTRQTIPTDEPQQVILEPKAPQVARRSLHSMVNKVKVQRKDQDTVKTSAGFKETSKETSKALFMLHLGPGDIYGDEITAPSGVFRSVHDIYADTTMALNSGATETGKDRPHTISTGAEVLLLDRQVFHSILAKTEEDAANELMGGSSNAKAKWQVASKKLFKRASHSSFEGPGGFIKMKKAPKLFDFFKNILNQRRFLTMGSLAHFPLLRDLPEDRRRELCLNARFEALDRYTDAYKGNGDSSDTGHRFFLLLAGRIDLVANGPSSHILSQNTNTPIPDHNLREIVAGEGFGEFEILVPEAEAYTAAVAAEPTKLLSIPADMFMRHWPCTQEARNNIEYLRTQIPSFASLDLERIAYLYHSFSFQTHVRGTSIFQLQHSPGASVGTKQVFLIKEGTCSIRQRVTLISHPDSESRWDNGENLSTQTKRMVKGIKVMVTVADVSAGHVFWVDHGYDPITLVATSAAVTIASISVDKLKAIVPRGLLSELEDLSEQLRGLYGQQFELAKRVTATMMNEKLAAQTREPQLSQRLPTIHARAAQSGPGSPSRGVSRSHEAQNNGIADADGLYENIDADKVNFSYSVQHRIERYDIPNDLPASYLVGSFLDKNEWHYQRNNQSARRFAEHPSKQDEYSALELVNEAPVAHRPKGGPPSSRNLAKLATAPAPPRGQSMRGNDGAMFYEVDVRARVHAQMCTIESPMRAMRLGPSCTPVRSLGKYYADCPSPFTKSGDSYRRNLVQTECSPIPSAVTIVKTPQRKVKRSDPKRHQTTQAGLIRKQGFLTALRLRSTVRLESDKREILESILPRIHKGRRFYYTLVDCELLEYADTISLNNLAGTTCLRQYNLYNARQSCAAIDVSVTGGGAEAFLRQSFILLVDDATQFFFTASSAIDKQKWMAELNQACTLGGSMSVKVQSPRSIVTTPPPAGPASLAAVVIDAFKGRRQSTIQERRRSSIFVPKPKPDDALQVEYRIS